MLFPRAEPAMVNCLTRVASSMHTVAQYSSRCPSLFVVDRFCARVSMLPPCERLPAQASFAGDSGADILSIRTRLWQHFSTTPFRPGGVASYFRVAMPSASHRQSPATERADIVRVGGERGLPQTAARLRVRGPPASPPPAGGAAGPQACTALAYRQSWP